MVAGNSPLHLTDSAGEAKSERHDPSAHSYGSDVGDVRESYDDELLEAALKSRQADGKPKSRRHSSAAVSIKDTLSTSSKYGTRTSRFSVPTGKVSKSSSVKSYSMKDDRSPVSSILRSIIPRTESHRKSVRSSRRSVKPLSASMIAAGVPQGSATSGASGRNPQLLVPRATYPVPDPHPAKAIPGRVLSEEDYTASLQTIIERDYYPDLPRLKATRQLLDAKATNDPRLIRAAKNQLIRSCTTPEGLVPAGLLTPQPSPMVQSPVPSETGEAVSSVPPSQVQCGSSTKGGESPGQSGRMVTLIDGREVNIDDQIKRYSLDQFQARYTSEDNASFEEIVEKERAARRRKEGWIEAAARNHNLKMCEALKDYINVTDDGPSPVPAITAGEVGTTDLSVVKVQEGVGGASPSRLPNSLLYSATEARTALIFHPETAHLPLAKVQEKTKEVCKVNTRFPTALQESDEMLRAQRQKQIDAAIRIREAKLLSSMVASGDFTVGGTDESSAGGSATPSTAAGVIGPTVAMLEHTPQIIPGVGVDASPIMTWGEIASTPTLLPSGIAGCSSVATREEKEQDFADMLAMLPHSRKGEYDGGGQFEIQRAPKEEIVAEQLTNRRSKASSGLKSSKRRRQESLQGQLLRSVVQASGSRKSPSSIL